MRATIRGGLLAHTCQRVATEVVGVRWTRFAPCAERTAGHPDTGKQSRSSNRREGSPIYQDDCQEGAEGHVKANGATVNSDDTRERRGELLHRRQIHGHGRRNLGGGKAAAGAERGLRHEGIGSRGEESNSDACEKSRG